MISSVLSLSSSWLRSPIDATCFIRPCQSDRKSPRGTWTCVLHCFSDRGSSLEGPIVSFHVLRLLSRRFGLFLPPPAGGVLSPCFLGHRGIFLLQYHTWPLGDSAHRQWCEDVCVCGLKRLDPAVGWADWLGLEMVELCLSLFIYWCIYWSNEAVVAATVPVIDGKHCVTYLFTVFYNDFYAAHKHLHWAEFYSKGMYLCSTYLCAGPSPCLWIHIHVYF